jgi:inner membrane protein
MSFHAYRSDVAALDAARGIPAVARLLWFDHGFAKATVRDGALVLSDLRMGSEPDYAFRFAVAERDGSGWRPIPPVDVDRRQAAQALKRLWKHWRGGDIEPSGDDARAAGAAR